MKLGILSAALVAASTLAFTAPADAVVVDYTFSGTDISGTMALNFGGSTYTLNSIDLTTPQATFTSGSLFPPPPYYTINMGSSDWFGSFNFDPASLSQSVKLTLINDATGAEAQDSLTITQLTAVPEPAAWSMMLLGFGAVGIALRRQRRLRLASA